MDAGIMELLGPFLVISGLCVAAIFTPPEVPAPKQSSPKPAGNPQPRCSDAH